MLILWSALKRTPQIAYRLSCLVVFIVLLVLCVPLLIHKSQAPRVLGLYSGSYLAVIAFYLAAIALTARGLRKATWQELSMAHLLKSYGFWFWLAVWLIFVLSSFAVWHVTDDGDFKNLGFGSLGGGVCLGWLVLSFAPRLTKLLTNTALGCTIALLGLFIAELSLAVFPILSSGVETRRAQKIALYQFERAQRFDRGWYQSLLIPDPELGYRQRPNAVTTRKTPSGATTTVLTTDAWGFFNRDSDSSCSYDVACVGDSFAAQPWPGLLQADTGLRVVSFGVPAYSPPQYTIVVERYVVKLKPKVLFYCLYGNDALEAAGYDAWKKSGLDWFTFQGRAWFGFTTSHAGRLLVKEYLLRASRIYALFDLSRLWRQSEKMPIAAHPIPYKTEKFTLVFDRGSFTVLTDMKSEAVRRGLEIVHASLAEASRLCSNAHIQMIVLLFPLKELVHYEALKERAKPGDPIENLPRFYEALRQICKEQHLEYCDVTDRFRNEAARTGKALYAEVDIHWDLDGLKLMARIAHEILESSTTLGRVGNEKK